MYRIGIDVGGTKIAVGLIDGNGKIIERGKVETNASRGIAPVIDDMLALSRSVTDKAGVSRSEIEFVGVGLPGAIDHKNGILIHASNLPYDNTPLAAILSKSWSTRVGIGNDANCAALGELTMGAACGHSDLLMLTLGTGIGGGIIIDRKIYSGFNGLAGEVGHMTIEIDGRQCTCGKRGCFEAYASATGLAAMTREAMAEHRDSLMWEDTTIETVGGRTAWLAASKGDRAGGQVIDRYIKYLAWGVSSLISVLQPEIICIGGGLSNAGDQLLTPLNEYVNTVRYTTKLPGAKIVLAELGNDAGIIGAAMLDAQ